MLDKCFNLRRNFIIQYVIISQDCCYVWILEYSVIDSAALGPGSVMVGDRFGPVYVDRRPAASDLTPNDA